MLTIGLCFKIIDSMSTGKKHLTAALIGISACTMYLNACAEGCMTDVDTFAESMRNSFSAGEIKKIPSGVKIACAEQKTKSIIIFEPSIGDWGNPDAIYFKWDANTAPGIREADRIKFESPTECKILEGGRKMLVTASMGGVAIVEIPSGKTLLYKSVTAPSETWRDANPHSAEMLPDGNIAVASSFGKRNLILLGVPEKFSSPEDIREFPMEFLSAHGVVWDESHEILWVLGYEELAGFKYNFDKQNPSVKKIFSAQILTNGKQFDGHDLVFAPETPFLIMTGDSEVRLFDTRTRKFATVRIFKDKLKSISMLPQKCGSATITVKPEKEYWAETVRFFSKNFPVVGNMGAETKFYKARWYCGRDDMLLKQ